MDDSSTETSMLDNLTEFNMDDNSIEINNYTSTTNSTGKVIYQRTQNFVKEAFWWNVVISLTLLAVFKIFKKRTWICKRNIKTHPESHSEHLCNCGYLIFQNYILKFMTAVLIMHLIVPLLIDYQEVVNWNSMFWGITGANIRRPNSPFLWGQATIAFLYLPLAIFTMRRFVTKVGIKANFSKPSKSVMITGYPLTLNHYIEEEYHNISVRKTVYVETMDDSSDMDTHNGSKVIHGIMEFYGRNSSQDDDESFEIFMQVHTKPNFFAGDSSEQHNYASPEEFYAFWFQEFSIEEGSKKLSLTVPFGTTIITMDHDVATDDMYESIVKQLEKSSKGKPNENRRSVQYVPHIDDLQWANLSYPQHDGVSKEELFIHLETLLFSAFQSIIVISTVIPESFEKATITGSNGLTLHLFSWYILMLYLEKLFDCQPHYWSKSVRRYKFMSRNYVYVLLMLVIFPSIIYESLDFWACWKIDHHTYINNLYVPYPGLGTINFIITSGFIGSAMELFRVKSVYFLSGRILERCLKQRFDEKYSFSLDISLIRFFGTTATILGIGPLNFWAILFGLICLIMKHLLDDYELSQINQTVMTTQMYAIGIKFFIIAAVIPQFRFLLFLLIHYGICHITLYSTFGIVLTVLFLLEHKYIRQIENIIPFPYQKCLLYTEPADSQFIPESTEDASKIETWETIFNI